MIEEVVPGVFRIEVPLPRNPLKFLNSYLIKGEERSLLVDTGFNWPECKQALVAAVKALGVDWPTVDFFITHLHWDHSGLVPVLATRESVVYCSEVDANIIRLTKSSAFWGRSDQFYLSHGYPEHELFPNPAETEEARGSIDFTYVSQGDVLEYGDYRLTCVSTPGHSPGHMCLYEPDHKFLIGGDHILAHISSNITARMGFGDALGQYLESLDKVNAMDISLVLPGHRNIIHDYRSRVAELKHHHQARLEEIMRILGQGAMSAYQVASRMHWDMSFDSWEKFPSAQKWFATGEAIAHLEHLAEKGRIQKTLKRDLVLYQLLH
jgi:glyoxylase-like metal-dependent hydrolase (beta-lactamase superfamily II)